MLLTTHYLEEAEALCGRIAMLKQGRVVALDRTSDAAAPAPPARCCASRLDEPLPPALAGNARVTGRIVQITAHDAREVESILAVAARRRLRRRKTSRSAAPTSRTCSSRSCAARRRSGSRHEHRGERGARVKVETGILAGTRTLLYKEVLRFWKVSFQTVAAPVLTAVLYLLIFGHVLEGRVKVFGAVGYTSFLVPGLVMMSVLQNAFANSLVADPEQDHRQPGVPAASRRCRTGPGSSPTSAPRSCAALAVGAGRVAGDGAGSRRCTSPTPLWILVFTRRWAPR